MRLGKDKQAIFLAVSLLLSASAGGQAGKSYKYQLNGNLQKSDVFFENQSVIINYSISELNVENIVNDNGSFFRISIPGHTPISTPGRPEVPVLSRLISVPSGAEYKVKISEVRSSRINPSKEKIEGILFPVQEGETKDITQKKPDFIIDKPTYAAHGIIPSDTVRIESLGTVRNKDLSNITIYPVRYNPHSNQIEVINSMKIEIIYAFADKKQSKSIFTESAPFAQSLDKGVLNYNPGDVIPGYSNKPLKMVIITDTIFRKHLEPFFKWKTQKGYKLKILYRGVGLAGNTYTQLKDTLTKIYNASTENDPPPEYLLIIGDVNKVPYYGTSNITDMYYGEFDGNGDYIPEMYIGRLPVADTTELKTVVNKIISYEKFQFADTNKFYSRAFVTAGNDLNYASTMNGQVKYTISNYLKKSDGIDAFHFYYPQSTGPNVIDSVKKIINSGLSFINYTGHGSSEGWLYTASGTNYFLKSSEIAQLSNKNMYPFVITNACRTAQFNLSSSLGNKMVVADEKGAIGYIGCSNDSYWDEDFYWAVGTGPVSDNPGYLGKGLGAFDRMFHTHGEPASEWYFTMGQINYAGNLSVSASTSSRKKYYWETYNLVGDPTVIPILRKPDAFKISLPDTLPNGIKSISLNVDPFSYIAVSHFDTLWDASFASPSGSVVLDMPGLSNDSCMIVITGQNKIPLIKTIYFSNIGKEFLNLSSSAINDSIGNNNGIADFGESFFLNLKISNLGLTDAEDLYAKISSSSDWVTINSDSTFIGTLSAGSEIFLSDDLGITISDNVPDKGIATFNLILKDKKTEKHYTIDVLIHAPQLQIISCNLEDSVLGNGNHIADTGETFSLVFKIRNQGSSSISGQFRVTSPNSYITVLEPDIKSGLLKFGEITEIPITIKLSESALTGNFISISSMLDCSPFLANRDFTFRVGRIRESFEASNFNIFPWINASQVPWTVTGSNSYDGNFSARSGAISHSDITTLMMRAVYSTADSLKFFYKVSSEPSYDNFSFKLNDAEVFRKSGETSWIKKVISVPAGLNKMEWIYKKDNSVSNGFDCAWIDMIDYAGSGSVRYIQKDLQVASLISPVQKDKYGQEVVSVVVRNLGKDPVDGFFLAYVVNNSYLPVKQFFENKIPFNDSVTVSFKVPVDMSKYGLYRIVTYGVENNDDYLLNDTARINIENINLNEDVNVFPNPFNDQFRILINSRTTDNLQISITNIKGERLYYAEKNILNGKNEIIVSDLRLSPAVYYLNIRGTLLNKTIPVLKVIK